MPKILLQTTCVTNPDNSFAKQEVFYTTGLLQTGVAPTSYENTTTISCSPFTLPVGTELERYCALAADGTGVMRVVRSAANLTNYATTDTPSTACDGTCDLNAPYVGTTPTSSPAATDGTIRLDITTSYPPITVYNPQLGSPTTQTLYTAPAVRPATYIVQYNNVRPGTYAIQIQDNNNCQFNTPVVTVATGAAPGTGTGLPADAAWFKYEVIGELVTSGVNTDMRLVTQGYAWNKTTKQGYAVAPIPTVFPNFYDLTPRYRAGDVVKFAFRLGFASINRYYIALADMVPSDFTNNNNRIPSPINTIYPNYWSQIPVLNKSRIWYDTPTRSDGYERDYFDPGTPTGNINYWFYPEGTIVRYGWDGLYRARYKLTSRTPSGLIPAPVAGTTTNEWERVTEYASFFYAIPEAQAIDQYAVGQLNRRVRFHAYDPTDPAYVPTSTSSQTVAFGAVVPAQGNDFILFDDNTPTQETNLGDLKVIDIIKNDVDDAGAENGSVAVLATSPSLPIDFHLRNGVRTGYPQDNQTGIYEDLPAGVYTVDITDAENRYTSVEVTITDNYGKRWRLLFDDANKQPLSLFIYERGWTGPVTDVIGTGTPVVLGWDSGGDPGGYLPEAVGATLDFQVITEIAQQFVDTILHDDRYHRVDYYRGNKLQFRGYLDATQYQERMLGPGQPVTITATDGLGKLKSTQFINHLSERQLGRTSMLSVLLKCLSFCDINLPVLVGVNLRDRLMTANGDPLLEALCSATPTRRRTAKSSRTKT